MDNFVNLFNAAVLAGAPLLFGTIGEILTEKSGNLNLGVEGLMFMGAIGGLSGVYFTEMFAGSLSSSLLVLLIAILSAFLCGCFGSLIYAFLTVTLRANQNVTGLTLTIFGTGIANFLGDVFSTSSAGNYMVISNSAKLAFGNQPILPFLARLGEDSMFWNYVNRLFFSYNFLVYLGILFAVLMALFLNRPRVGLNLRAVGESPATADAAGIAVNRYKYLATVIGGGICGIGGMYISMVTAQGVWIYNCVGGRGWIAVALVIFATWGPARAILGGIIFGGLTILRMYVPMGIPIEIYDLMPYAATILVLIFTSIRQSKEHAMPKHCGLNYFREER